MREIKFRAWDKLKKSVHEVAVIDFVVPYAALWKQKGRVRSTYEVELDTIKLMQYTGLKDKNGQDIYEGDILKGQRGNYPVSFHDGEARFHAGLPHAYLPTIDWWRFEIIGNIYENPELLEAK